MDLVGVLGWILLIIVGLTVLSLPKVLIDLGWERGGKWLIAAYIVNTICIVIAGFAGLYVLLVGAGRLLDENIGSFVPDDKAKQINAMRANGEPYWRDFNQIDVETRTELDNFVEQVQALDSTDPLFHQRVYSLIGVEYSPRLNVAFETSTTKSPARSVKYVLPYLSLVLR